MLLLGILISLGDVPKLNIPQWLFVYKVRGHVGEDETFYEMLRDHLRRLKAF